MKFSSKLLLLINIIFFAQTAYASCTISRFNDLKLLSDIRSDFSDISLEFKMQREAVEQKQRNEKWDRNTPPLELNLALSGSQVGGQVTTGAEVRLSYDINFPLQFMNRARSMLLDENYNKRLGNILLEERLNFLNKALSWKYANLQRSMYVERVSILSEREAYLTEKERQGASVSDELSKLKLEVISLKNKIMAVEARAEILLLEFENVNLKLLEDIDLSWSGTAPDHLCSMTSYEMTLAQDNIKYYSLQKKIDVVGNSVSANLFASQDLQDFESDPTLGVTMNFTVISPKKRGNALRSTQEELDQAKRDLYLAGSRLKKLITEQNKVEELISANISAIDQEIVNRELMLEELSVRAALGQTIFDQKSSLLLELSNLNEARSQRVFDLYSGWLQFIKVKGIEG